MSGNNCFSYKYPHPAVTTDCVIFGFDGKELRVLLIERGQEPYKGMFAFPGGFLNMDETLEECALRELKEETSLEVDKLEQIHAFSSVNRDPRERVISVAFFGLVKMSAVAGGDDARTAQWIRLEDIPPLAFDHDYILRKAINFLKKKMFFEPIGFDLLDETFTIPQLQRLYQAILGVEFDRRNFKRKMLQLGLIDQVDEESIEDEQYFGLYHEMKVKSIDSLFESSDSIKNSISLSHDVGRKPQRFKFNKERYEELKENPGNFRLEF